MPPGAKSTQLNHYVLPALDKFSFDAAAIQYGINAKLRSKGPNDLNDLSDNVIKVEKSVIIMTLVKYSYQ